MSFLHIFWFVLVLVSETWGKTTTKAVVLFGDSYTDQSRQHSIQNGTFPGKDYQEVFPPAATAADGGVQWPWYLGLLKFLTLQTTVLPDFLATPTTLRLGYGQISSKEEEKMKGTPVLEGGALLRAMLGDHLPVLFSDQTPGVSTTVRDVLISDRVSVAVASYLDAAEPRATEKDSRNVFAEMNPRAMLISLSSIDFPGSAMNESWNAN
ncbi:hypothetical protein DFH09DRAFT_1335843 [Mycena vulgaris]|nr:hypothetical protein DFH09DRAFT_1335843 [Mycena vulgaris]